MTIATGLTQASPARHRVLALAALALPTMLVAVDISVMSVALPSIARDLHPSASGLLWITDSYNYLVAGAMLTMGALGDRIGRRRLILVCAAVFALASAAGAFATTASLVIIARAVMGVAGSAIMPASLSLIGVLFPEPKARVQAMGAYMTVFLVGMTAAPFLGGVLLAHFWWGSVFLIGVPVMVVTILIVPVLLPESRSEHAPPLDLISTAQSIAAVLALVYALKTAVNDGVTPVVWLAGLAGLAVGAAFLRRQRRLPHPLLDLTLLTSPATARVLAALFLTALLMGGSSIFFALYLQEVQGLAPVQAAGWMVPQMLAMIVASNVGPVLARHLPRRLFLGGMLAVMTVGFALFALLPATTAGLPMVAIGSALATFGIGAIFPTLMDGVMSSAPPERAGAGAALAQLSNELGIAVGLTVLGSVGTLIYRAVLDLPSSTAAVSVVNGTELARTTGDAELLAEVGSAFTVAYNVIGVIAIGVMLGVLLLTVGRRRSAE